MPDKVMTFADSDAAIMGSIIIGPKTVTGDMRAIIYAGAFGRAVAIDGPVFANAVSRVLERKQLCSIDGRPC